MGILRKSSMKPASVKHEVCVFRYIGKAPALPNGNLIFRVPQVKFQIEFPRDEPFQIVDDGTPQRKFVLKCIRGAREYEWDTGGQIKQYEEITDQPTSSDNDRRRE